MGTNFPQIMLLLLFCLLAAVESASLRQEKRRGPKVFSLIKREPRFVPKSFLRLSSPSGTQHLPLKGSLDTTASFYLPIGIGTPPQTLNVLVDTGSTDLVVFDSSCQGCPPARNYSVAKSKTGSEATCEELNFQCSNQCDFSTCQFQDDYGGGGEITGSVMRDVVNLGSWPLKYVYFGAITDDEVAGDFVIPPEDGIMGFAYSALSSWQQPCVFDYAGLQEGAYNSFSMCLTTDSPVLELGTNYRSQAQSSYNWTTLYDNPGWLSVYLEDAGMAGQSLGLSKSHLNSQNVIVDSGTTLLIVSTKMMEIYTQRLEAMCTQGVNLVGVCNQTTSTSILNGHCFNMTQQQVDMYPTVYFSLYNNDDHSSPFTLTIGPRAILQQICGGGPEYAFGIQAMDSTPVILGDVLIQNYHVVFDKEDSVIGFGSLTNCPSA